MKLHRRAKAGDSIVIASVGAGEMTSQHIVDEQTRVVVAIVGKHVGSHVCTTDEQ